MDITRAAVCIFDILSLQTYMICPHVLLRAFVLPYFSFKSRVCALWSVAALAGLSRSLSSSSSSSFRPSVRAAIECAVAT